MDISQTVDIGRQAIWITMLVSAPMLLIGLVVGIVIGIFQAVTQIHEMTLTFIPKIIAIIGIIIFILPWIIVTLVNYTTNLFALIPTIIH